MKKFLQLFGFRSPVAPSSSLPFWQACYMADMFASLLKKEGYKCSTKTIQNTNSMIPAMDSNTVLIVEEVQYEDLREGDVVIYNHPTVLSVVHALFEKQASGNWFAKGYNNNRIDSGVVTRENFCSRVVLCLHAQKNSTTDK